MYTLVRMDEYEIQQRDREEGKRKVNIRQPNFKAIGIINKITFEECFQDLPTLNIDHLDFSTLNLKDDQCRQLCTSLKKCKQIKSFSFCYGRLKAQQLKDILLSISTEVAITKLSFYMINFDNETLEIISKLISHNCSSLESVSIMSLDLSKDENNAMFKLLCKSIQKCKLDELFLIDLNLKEGCGRILSKMIQKMPYLETLNLDGNKSIFQNNVIDLNYLLMGGVLTNSTIKTLSLNQCKLKDECLQVIIKFLSKNQHVKELDLNGNKFEDHGIVIDFWRVLNRNQVVESIGLGQTYMGFLDSSEGLTSGISSLNNKSKKKNGKIKIKIKIKMKMDKTKRKVPSERANKCNRDLSKRYYKIKKTNDAQETRKPSTEGTDSSSDSEIDDELTRKYFLEFIHKHNKLKKATFLSGYTRNETVFLTQCLHTNKYINHLTLHPDSMTGTGFQYFEMLLSTLTNLKSFEISYPWNNEEFVPIMYAIINYSRYLKTLSISCDESEGKGSVDAICKLISLKSKKIKNLTISDINDLQLRKFNKLCTALLKNTKLEHVNMPVTTELNTKGWNKILNILDNNIHLNQFTMVYEDLEDFNRSPFEFKAQLLLNRNKRLQNTIIKDFYYYWQRRILKNNHEKIIKIANFPVDIKILKLRFPNNNINSIINALKLLFNHGNDNNTMFIPQNIHDFIRWLYTGLTTNRPVIFFYLNQMKEKSNLFFPETDLLKFISTPIETVLFNNYYSIELNSVRTDLIIVDQNNNELQIHSFVFQARSKLFNDFMTQRVNANYNPYEDNAIIFKDYSRLSKSSLKIFIGYLYFNKFIYPSNFDNNLKIKCLIQLQDAANFFQLYAHKHYQKFGIKNTIC